MFFFHNDEKNHCLYCNLLQFPYCFKFFCLALLGILTNNHIDDYPYSFAIIVTLNVTRRLEGYRYMSGRRNIMAIDCMSSI